MKSCAATLLPVIAAAAICTLTGCKTAPQSKNTADRSASPETIAKPEVSGPELSGFYYETTNGRTMLPATFAQGLENPKTAGVGAKLDGRVIRILRRPDTNSFTLSWEAVPNDDITGWGFSVKAAPDEYFTGLMERVVDGDQKASWATNITAAMNLRGQKVDMIVKPTMSIYAPFYVSSHGYATFARTDWPGKYDFCASDSNHVQISFEGPSLEVKFYTGGTPAELVKAHALDAGPPFLPPKWMYQPWRWRDEHTQRAKYYDGTPVTGPFNSEMMEDVLLMKAYGIPCGVYWIDRPWGPGKQGYDDFEIDTNRLPNFQTSIKWIEQQGMKMVLWIGPFFQGEMETNALKMGYTIACQKPQKNNYPMVDLTNPDAKKYWQDGVAKLLKMDVAGFKMDRSEENIPESGPYKVFDGRSIRENRDAYPPMYLKAAYDVCTQYRTNDFVCMPRAAYTGSSHYGVFWGGDIGGTQEGLRASIIAVQRAAVMGYPNWGSDTCGYNQQQMETEVCARWLAFSCFTPIMEVGPTKNRAFWNFHTPPSYDSMLVACWRFYARLHQRLADYAYGCAQEATTTGTPIIRPLFLVEPQARAAWANWWTYQYGPDILISPIWKKGQRTQEVYLPSGNQWRDAWTGKVSTGGRNVTVTAEMSHLPIFVRVGATVDLGDLNKEWDDAKAIAQTHPDLKKLDADTKKWFESGQQQ